MGRCAVTIAWSDWSPAHCIGECQRDDMADRVASAAVGVSYLLTGDTLVVRLGPTEVADCVVRRVGKIEGGAQ